MTYRVVHRRYLLVYSGIKVIRRHKGGETKELCRSVHNTEWKLRDSRLKTSTQRRASATQSWEGDGGLDSLELTSILVTRYLLIAGKLCLCIVIIIISSSSSRARHRRRITLYLLRRSFFSQFHFLSLTFLSFIRCFMLFNDSLPVLFSVATYSMKCSLVDLY